MRGKFNKKQPKLSKFMMALAPDVVKALTKQGWNENRVPFQEFLRAVIIPEWRHWRAIGGWEYMAKLQKLLYQKEREQRLNPRKQAIPRIGNLQARRTKV